MKKLIALLLLLATPVFAGSTAENVTPGYLTSGGKFNPYTSANPMPVGVSASSGITGTLPVANGGTGVNPTTLVSANPTPLGDVQSLYVNNIIQARHYLLSTKLYDASNYGVPVGSAIGNSITAGTGASSPSNQWTRITANLLQGWSQVSTTSAWASNDYGVGGANLTTVAAYVADNGDGLTIARNTMLANSDYIFVQELRNSNVSLTALQYSDILRATIRQIKREGRDAIFVSENPQVDTSTGAILDTQSSTFHGTISGATLTIVSLDSGTINPGQVVVGSGVATGTIISSLISGSGGVGSTYSLTQTATVSSSTAMTGTPNFPQLLNAARAICAEEGATFIDTWTYFLNMSNAGYNLTNYTTSDGTHPNNAGHAIIGQLVFQGLITPVLSNPAFAVNRNVSSMRSYLISSYKPSYTNGTANAAISGLTTLSTARQVQLGEATPNATTLTGTQQAYYSVPNLSNGYFVTNIGGSAYTGTATVTNGGSLNGSTLAGGPYVREQTVFSTWNTGGTFNSPATIVVTANSANTVAVSGVVFLGADESTIESPPLNNVKTGGADWGTGTLTTGESAITNATIGDTFTETWYGTAFDIVTATGVSYGKFSYATDGGASTTIDGYLNASDNTATTSITGLAETWHSTVFTIVTKNASSSGNTVKFGRFLGFTYSPMDDYRFVTVGTSSVNMPQYWKQARIETTLSGSPTVNTWVPGRSTISVGGSGVATLRVTR